MAEFNDMQTALDTPLFDYLEANDGAFLIAWANAGIDDYENETVRPSFLPGDTIQSGMGESGLDVTNGLYQMDIFTKRGEGRSALIDTVSDLYKRGQTLTSGAAKLRLRGSSIGTSRYEGDWFITPITVNWQTYTEAR